MNLQPKVTRYDPENDAPKRYRVKATDQEMLAVTANGNTSDPSKLQRVGGKNNVAVISLCDEETGEVRAYLDTAVEPVTGA